MAKQGQKPRPAQRDSTNDRLRSESTSLSAGPSLFSQPTAETRRTTPATTNGSDRHMAATHLEECKSSNPQGNSAPNLSLTSMSRKLGRITVTGPQATEHGSLTAMDSGDDIDNEPRRKRKCEEDSEWSEFDETSEKPKQSAKDGHINEDNAYDYVNKQANHDGTTKGKQSGKSAKTNKKPSMTKWERQEAAGRALDNLHQGNLWVESAVTAGLKPQNIAEQESREKAQLKRLVMQDISREHLPRARKDWDALNESLKLIGGYKLMTGDRLRIEGTKTSLHIHQVTSTGFMLHQEQSETGPQGGIIASHMGLGKTLSALGLIANKPAPGNPSKYKGATLIIAGPALLQQWRREIIKHSVKRSDRKKRTYGIGKFVLLQEELDRAKHRDNGLKWLENKLREADVVLATYNRTLMSWNSLQDTHKPRQQKRQKTNKSKRASSIELAGMLHKFEWHRIILDEAHAIKDTSTATFKACYDLKTQHVWCITGTPVMNSTSEIYSYFNLMRHPDAESPKDFQDKYLSKEEGLKEQSQQNLQDLLGDYMMRYKHSDTLFNKKLINLPEPVPPITFYVTFSDVEQKIYDWISNSYVRYANKLEPAHRLPVIRGMSLRLRQFASHPYFLTAAFEKILDRSDYEAIRDIITSVGPQQDVTASIEASYQMTSLLTRAGELALENEDPKGFSVSCKDLVAPDKSAAAWDDDPLPGSTFGRQGMQVQKILEALETPDVFSKLSANTSCAVCDKTPVDPHRSTCVHIFCLRCMVKHVQKLDATCPTCESTMGPHKPCFTPTATQPHAPAIPTTVSAMPRQTDDYFSRSDNLIPSSKVLMIKTVLLKLLPKGAKSAAAIMDAVTVEANKAPSDDSSSDGAATDPRDSDDEGDDEEALNENVKPSKSGTETTTIPAHDTPTKVVIFSQFKGTLKLIGHLCEREGWTYEFYTGDDDLDTRQQCLNRFRDNENVQILLATLKCGGEGLNLAAASKVLIVEPWWNDAAEYQAFCRVHRIGQTKNCELYRIAVAGSVDEDIMKLKEKKLIETDCIMTKSSAMQAFLRKVDDMETAAVTEELALVDDAHAAG